jgi:hypothetical protein
MSKTVWYDAKERKLQLSDVGKLVAGIDGNGDGTFGLLISNGDSLEIRDLSPRATSASDVPADWIILYVLIDPSDKVKSNG